MTQLTSSPTRTSVSLAAAAALMAFAVPACAQGLSDSLLTASLPDPSRVPSYSRAEQRVSTERALTMAAFVSPAAAPLPDRVAAADQTTDFTPDLSSKLKPKDTWTAQDNAMRIDIRGVHYKAHF